MVSLEQKQRSCKDVVFIMTKVKICGIKRKEDVGFINRHLPDYAGFVFAESKRRVTAEEAEVLACDMDRRIKRVGVFVNEKLSSVIDTIRKCRLDAVQLHGDETPEYIAGVRNQLASMGELRGTEIWKAVRIKGAESLESLFTFKADRILLDTYTEGAYGGSGQTFDWKLALKLQEHFSIIVAGGLNNANVRQAIRTVSPFAVDVSSGVETNGVKDEDKIKDFIYSARYNFY